MPYYSRERKFGVKMGDYENYTFGASFGATHRDLGYDDDEWAALTPEKREQETLRLRDAVNRVVADELVDELRDAALLTDNNHSFILREMPEDEPELESAPKEEPTTTVRRIRRPG